MGSSARRRGGGADAAPPWGRLKGFTLNLARLVEGAAALVIALASLRAFVGYLAGVGERGADVPKEALRLSLGKSLALALEFELGADILKTAVAPAWNDIGLLAAVAVLRTALNFFLGHELRQAESRKPSLAGRVEASGQPPA